MSLSSHVHHPTVRPVTIPYSDIQDKNANLSAMIEEGFGPNGLGIISISSVMISLAFSVPGFASLRQALLYLSPKLAKLPEEEKKKLEDPDSRYNFGWSHGKEKLESGKPDMLKGSFYANPILDVPTLDQTLIRR
ncbi:Rho GTPase-activating protein 29 [Bienertia sinuspersici]